ncbi:MAG TPA: hypothetical protein VML55_01990 [Planctomycetaceae bacterium]|nr:hypothetical protein [Planctomycetaceae bacterium]
MVLALAGGIAVVLRVGRYVDGHAPPISLRGRVGTGRLIVPGYDRVLLAPAVAALAGAGIPFAFRMAGWDLQIGLAISTAATLLAILSLGPTLEEWRLTGNHRIVAGFGPTAR